MLVGTGSSSTIYTIKMEGIREDGEAVVNLTADEAEQYDRQIRLWGLEAQKRLRSASVLVVGVRGLGAEVCKNLVLAGIRGLTVLDPGKLTPEDIAGRFLTQTEGENRAEQALPRLQVLNPNVTVRADTENVEDKSDDYFTQFNVVCVTCCTTDTLLRLNEICRSNGIKFFCGDVWGYYGYFFTDLSQHEYAIEVPKEKNNDSINLDAPRKREKANTEKEMVTIKKSCSFCSLKESLSIDWGKKPAKYFRRTPTTFFIIQTLQAFRDQHGSNPCCSHDSDDRKTLLLLKEQVATKCNISNDLIPEDFTNYCNSELSPVCAIVGGVLGQEIIKAISAKDHPYNNCFLYDGQLNSGIVESLTP